MGAKRLLRAIIYDTIFPDHPNCVRVEIEFREGYPDAISGIIHKDCMPAFRTAAHAEELLEFVECVAAGMGNLPLDRIGPDGVHGINDGKQRAIYLERFVANARAVVAKCKESCS